MNGGFSERFASEAADVLDSILTHSRDCIKLLDLEGGLQYVSASAKNALGLADNSEAIGRSWCDFWPEGERGAVEAAIIAARSGSSARFDGVTQSIEGERRFWEVTVSPVRDADKRITRLIAVSTEVTAQREAAEQGQRRWERAEREASVAGDISRELRHRLKNQLAVVNAVTKLLARHTSDARELAQKLEDKLIALGKAQDLLAIRRERPLTADQAVVEVIAASGAGDRIEVSGSPEVELPDEAVQQLALLLGELQTNALKHGALHSAGGRVRLWGEADQACLTLHWEEDCGQAVVSVDTGNGGFQLIRRLGSTGGKQPEILWQAMGIHVVFHVKATV